MNTYEVEQKYRIQNPKKLRILLLKLKAVKLGGGAESNEFFDFKRMFLNRGSVLRLRYFRRKGMLTFKGPRVRGTYKKRLEIESAVDYRAIRSILIRAGFKITAVYFKRRQQFKLDRCLVVLDHFDKLGWFCEIEGKARDIERLERKLGLKKTDRESKTYLELLFGKLGRR